LLLKAAMIQTSVSIKHPSAVNQRNTFSRLLPCYWLNMLCVFLKVVLSAYKNTLFYYRQSHLKKPIKNSLVITEQYDD